MRTDQRLIVEQPDIISVSEQQPSKTKDPPVKNCCSKILQNFLQAILHFFKLYRYNDKFDFLLLFSGIVLAIGTGFGLPLFAVVAGKTIDAFDKTPQQLADQADTNKNLLLIIGFSMFVIGTLCFSVWLYLGERVSIKFRQLYLKSLMKQQISYFQSVNVQQISQKFEEHMINIKQAAGLKAGTLIYIAASFTIAGKVATASGFFLSLVMIPTLPILGISGFLFSIFVQLKNTRLMHLYAKADQKVRQSLGLIRTVKQLNGQSYQVNIFEKLLQLVKQKVLIYCFLAGLGAGIFSLMQYLVYCLAFWLGSQCISGTSTCAKLGADQRYTPGGVILIFFAFFVRLDSMQQLFPALKRIYNGTSSYEKVYKIISRKPLVSCPSMVESEVQIDFRTMKLSQVIAHMKQKAKKLKDKVYLNSNINPQTKQDQKGEKVNTLTSLKIEFKNVTVYSKKDSSKKILDNLSFVIDKPLIVFRGAAEQKQTILDLILRLYDPDKGTVLINDIEIQKINLCHLRSKIGYLDRNTYLFQTTIKQNITMGRTQISDDLIWYVLHDLQIAETIKLLDEQIYSEVGFQGNRLSERLKRKIILARVLVKNPQIILFKDQYTQTEEQQYGFYLNIQKLKNCKTVIYAGVNEKIIKKSNKIFVLDLGKIQAEGDYYSLPNYYQEEIAIGQDFIGTNKLADPLYKSTFKSSLKSSVSLKSSDAIFVNQSDQVSHTAETSPQKMILQYENSNLNKYKGQIHKRLFGYLKGNFTIYFLGCIVCLISGALYPVFTIFMSDILIQTFELQKNRSQSSALRDKISNPILFILWIGIASFIVSFLEIFIFSFIAEKMGEKLRIQILKKVLKLPMQWFSQSSLRSSFYLSQTIKFDPTVVQNLLTNFYSIILKNFSSFVVGLVIAFIYEWRSALLGFIVLPMMMASGYLSVIFYRNQTSQTNYIESASIVSQVISNMKAVHTQGCQELILESYRKKLQIPLKKARKKVVLSSMIFGFSQLLIFISYTIMFFFGTMFYRDNSSITTLNLLTAIFAVIWSGWTSGANFIRFPGKSSCEKAASNLFYLLDQIDQQQMQVRQKSKLLRSGIKGNIQFKDVKVNFTNRGFFIDKVSFKIQQKNQIAIFSTSNVDIKPIVDLLYRFLQPEQGKIFIDNENIKDYQISYLRSCLGFISDEPTIFNRTMRQNIVYNAEIETQQEVNKACFKANAMPIIEGKQNIVRSSLSTENSQNLVNWKGLDTVFDFDLKMISTGQKQRVVMSRLLLRQPKILLINDQIGSIGYFFDNSVRQAVNNIIKNRTSIYMPHYEQNLQSADAIIVLQKDRIFQAGNYLQLKRNAALFKRIKRNYYHVNKNL